MWLHMFPDDMVARAKRLTELLLRARWMLCSAESCTGGLFSAALTTLPGASEVFERGYVSYSNASKIELLTVPTYFIEEYGAVSLETAVAMAEGALLTSRAHIAVAITGIAGPTGGMEDKPVGTVYIATAVKGEQSIVQRLQLAGERLDIQLQSVDAALKAVVVRMEDQPWLP